MAPATRKARPFIVPIFISHAGCPHRCAFCNQHLISGVPRGLPSEETLRSTITDFLSYRQAGRRPVEISFYGGNFLGLATGEMHRLLEVAQGFVAGGRVDRLRCSTRPDTVTRQRLDLLAEFSVHTVELGVQSMDDRVLSAALRGHRAEDTSKAVTLLKACGYSTGLQMMVGLPEQHEASVMNTASRIAALAPDFVRIYPTLVLRGSLLEKWYRGRRYRPLSLFQAVDIVKRLYAFFEARAIPVARMGLQASESLDNASGILAGPYHPAFGHLVLSGILFDRAAAAIMAKGLGGLPVVIYVHPADISAMRGQQNDNWQRLQACFQLPSLRILGQASLSRNAPRAALDA